MGDFKTWTQEFSQLVKDGMTEDEHFAVLQRLVLVDFKSEFDQGYTPKESLDRALAGKAAIKQNGWFARLLSRLLGRQQAR